MNTKKPVIGLCSSYVKTEETEQIFLVEDYLRAIRNFGGIPLVIPATAGEEEQALLLKARTGNVPGAKALLNDLLGYVFFTEGGSLEAVRAHAIELTTPENRRNIIHVLYQRKNLR